MHHHKCHTVQTYQLLTDDPDPISLLSPHQKPATKIRVDLIPELGEKVKPELSYLLSELRNRSISEVLELFQ